MPRVIERIHQRGPNAQRTLVALEDACDQDTALAVLERALEQAVLHAVPEDDEAFALFVSGPLLAAAQAIAGDSAARAVASAISPASHPAQGPLAIVASADPARASRIRAALDPAFEMRVAEDLAALVAEVEGHLDRRLSLVLDGNVPGVNGPLLSTLARLMPPSASLLFRGDPPSGLYAIGLTWTTLPEDASAEEVAQHLAGRAPDAPQRSTPRPLLVLADPSGPARASLARRLEQEGYLVIQCEDALSALEASIEHEPELLISVREMPALDGLALARLVRARMGDAAPTVLLRGAGPLARDDAKLARVVNEDELLDEARELVPARR